MYIHTACQYVAMLPLHAQGTWCEMLLISSHRFIWKLRLCLHRLRCEPWLFKTAAAVRSWRAETECGLAAAILLMIEVLHDLTSMYIYIHIFIHKYVCIYIYIFIYLYIYMYNVSTNPRVLVIFEYTKSCRMSVLNCRRKQSAALKPSAPVFRLHTCWCPSWLLKVPVVSFVPCPFWLQRVFLGSWKCPSWLVEVSLLAPCPFRLLKGSQHALSRCSRPCHSCVSFLESGSEMFQVTREFGGIDTCT